MQCKTVSASVACACVCVCVCVCASHTHTHTHTCSRHTMGMVNGAHAHRTQTADRGEEKRREEKRREEKRREEKRREEKRREEKRREEGLKFSISGYRLQQCLMQKKKNHNSKMPSCLFPKVWWETFPKAWWSLGNNRAEPGRRETTECVFKSLESFFLCPSGFLLSLTAGSDIMRERGQRRRGWSERELRWRERQPVS